MNLHDVKIDGTTPYLCVKVGLRPCVIEASFASDGATLVACSYEEDTFLDLWVTEACFLMPLGTQGGSDPLA